MKKISKKDSTIERALDALKKQALLEEELKQLRGGGVGIGIGHTDGMWTP